MNVKFSENAVTFKISEEELYRLSNGQDVENIYALGGAVCHRIESVGDQKDEMMLVINDMSMILHVPMRHIKTLLNIGKNREGIHTNIGDTKLSLQVDIRKDSRKRMKG